MEENIYNSHANIESLEFNYKNFLNENNFRLLINEYINALMSTEELYRDNLEFTDLNYITADTVFDRVLGILCVEDFDEDLHNKLFESGAYDFLKENVRNANRAYKLAKEIASKVDSLSTVLNSFAKQMPTNLDIKNLNDELNDVANKYKEIVSNDTNQE